MMDVYISNLKHNVTEDDLRTRLGEIGLVSAIEIHHSPDRAPFAVVCMIPTEKIASRSRIIHAAVAQLKES
jgi:RNA recognition motif-containing protein